MPPALKLAVLPEKVLWVTFTVPPLFEMPPPKLALLPEKVLLVTFTVAPLPLL